MSPASNSRDRRAIGGPEDDDEALETQGLLDQDRQTSSSNHDEQLHPSSNAAVTTMGFKDLIQRVSIFKHHDARSPLERDLVRRLDIFLMTFGCISQIIKYLDQTNISSAYVSGMKEDLGLYGNELNYFTTWFSVSYCIMLIPSQVIMTWVKPSWWLPGLEIGWGIMTGLIALCQNAKQVYVLRVFLGLFESSAWPGMMTLFMYWYTPSELAKRMALYQSCQSMGSMLSGALQTAMLDTLDGHHGIAGWRWLFIVNAIMTVVVGFAGFFMLPDYPSRPNPPKRTSRMWVSYFIPILYIATVLAQYGYNYFNLFLKSLKNPDGSPTWSTSQVNTIPIAGGAINVAFVWFWAILSDMFQTRWTLLVAQAVIGLIPAITMSIWTRHPSSTPLTAAYASYFISYLCLGTAPLIMSWLSDLLPQDPEARTLILGYAIAGVYAIIAWSQVLVWPASEAPYYKHAWQVSIALWILVIFMTVFLRVVDVRFLLPKRLAARAPVIEAGKSDDDDVVAVDASGGPVNPKRTEIEAVA
ncbi:putative transporter SEO1 [Cytospora mali]|uniref:Transporter SEO1 n=1 Tax=Cytospora mali TaxID=578113 RepID=A0A194VAH0_CYTMA|nr:putative transporter SEO1 [Valsa mali var. pyri (nom. inval.)]